MASVLPAPRKLPAPRGRRMPRRSSGCAFRARARGARAARSWQRWSGDPPRSRERRPFLRRRRCQRRHCTRGLLDRHGLARQDLLFDEAIPVDDDAIDRDVSPADDDLVTLSQLVDPDLSLRAIPQDPRGLPVVVEQSLDGSMGLLHGRVTQEVTERHEPHHRCRGEELPPGGEDRGCRSVEHIDVERSALRDGPAGASEYWDGGAREQPRGERGFRESAQAHRDAGQREGPPRGGFVIVRAGTRRGEVASRRSTVSPRIVRSRCSAVRIVAS